MSLLSDTCWPLYTANAFFCSLPVVQTESSVSLACFPSQLLEPVLIVA